MPTQTQIKLSSRTVVSFMRNVNNSLILLEKRRNWWIEREGHQKKKCLKQVLSCHGQPSSRQRDSSCWTIENVTDDAAVKHPSITIPFAIERVSRRVGLLSISCWTTSDSESARNFSKDLVDYWKPSETWLKSLKFSMKLKILVMMKPDRRRPDHWTI